MFVIYFKVNVLAKLNPLEARFAAFKLSFHWYFVRTFFWKRSLGTKHRGRAGVLLESSCFSTFRRFSVSTSFNVSEIHRFSVSEHTRYGRSSRCLLAGPFSAMGSLKTVGISLILNAARLYDLWLKCTRQVRCNKQPPWRIENSFPLPLLLFCLSLGHKGNILCSLYYRMTWKESFLRRDNGK